MKSANILPAGTFMVVFMCVSNVEEFPRQLTVVFYKLLMNTYIRVTLNNNNNKKNGENVKDLEVKFSSFSD